ncbi:MAG TPA: efflux RND transporter periplasmic adaptor subunit [Planctomycetota bacterium]|nr:efflux RND transporter periplasmic adaptor subunit [Planctomycetota bacterium]
MKKRSKIVLAVVGLAVVASVVVVRQKLAGKEAVDVELHTIARKDLAAIIQASGKIHPKTMVDISAAVSGKVLEVAVKEGDTVKKDQLLLRIDPTPFQTQVEQLEAAIASARATADQMQANVKQARQDRERLEHLYSQQLVSLNEVQKSRTTLDVEEARVRGAEQELLRLGANLSEARHELTKVDVHSDIDGTVVALNIEAGENAFVGAFNNPATVLLSVADLGVIEAEVEVDETEAVRAQPGQLADVEVDAHPGWVFHGRVSEVGHSPLRLQTGGEREGTAFKVKIAVVDTIAEVRPGLTCSAKIRTEERANALAVPIQALTLRKPDSGEAAKDGGAPAPAAATLADDGQPGGGSPDRTAPTGPVKKLNEKGKVEGVFVAKDGSVSFRRVTVGITGEKDFEIVSGLEEGDVIVTGPFKALRTLKTGDHVKQSKKKETKPGEDPDEEPDGAKSGGSGA